MTFERTVGTVALALSAAAQQAATALTSNATGSARVIYLRLFLAGGLGLLAIIVSVIVSVWIGRGLVRQLRGLRESALELAHARLPRVVAKLSTGRDVDVDTEVSALETGPDEIGQVQEAFNAVQLTAIEAAVGQARLRSGLSTVFRNLAQRSQSLLHRQLSLLDGLERQTASPEELEWLFRIDHLITRMRRHAEGLIVLAGDRPGRGWNHLVPLVDVLRAAVPVRVVGDLVARGFAVDIEDRGGTTAIVFIPRDLVVTADSYDIDSSAREENERAIQATGRHASRMAMTAAALSEGVPGNGDGTDGHGSADSAEWDAFIPMATISLTDLDQPAAPGAPADSEGTATTPGAPEAARNGSDGGDLGEPGLPRRIRQASLAPELRDVPTRNLTDIDGGTRTPEQTRDTLSALQRGWERGRGEPAAPGAAEPGSDESHWADPVTETMADWPDA